LPVAFPLTRRLGDPGFLGLQRALLVFVDEMLSRLTHWNLRYHAVKPWQKIRPIDIYLVAQKAA